MSEKWDILHESSAQVGEGPSWDAANDAVMWVDILAGEIHKTVLSSGSTSTTVRPHSVGAVVPRSGGGLAAAVKGGFELFEHWDDANPKVVEIQDAESNRMNDGKCDTRGRFWAGTMDESAQPERGRLYRFDPDHSVTDIVQGVSVSNGIGWSPDNRYMYYIDSATYRMDKFDFDEETGAVSERRELVEFDPDGGIPDGLCIDAEGGIWVALFGGSRVDRYTAEGRLSDSTTLPVSNPTSAAFVGAALDVLVVTSAALHADMDLEPLAGCLFTVDPGVNGLPTSEFAG